MKLIDKIRRLFGKKTGVPPKLLGYTVVMMAELHAANFDEAGVLPEGADIEGFLKELLWAYFCLASLWVGNHMDDELTLNR